MSDKRRKESAKRHREIRIYGISVKSKTALTNIAKNLDSDVSSLLRPKIAEWLNTFPDSLKQYIE